MSKQSGIKNVLLHLLDSVLRTTYDELYKFIKGTLTSEEITW